MASVKLKLKTSQELKDGSHPIILQVLKDNKKAIITIGLSCLLKDWNTSTNLPKNRRLSIICQKKLLEMEELLYEGIENDWDAKKIVNIFSGKDTKELMFFKYRADVSIESKIGISTNLLENTKLNKFKKFLGKDDISFSDINYELLRDYKSYLDSEGLKSATRYLSAIRQVYNHAIENDDFIPKKNPFKSNLFSKKITTTTQNRNLSKEQIIQLFKMRQTKVWKISYRDIALDLWRLAFLMRGINFIEIALMRPEGVKGEYYVFTREKLKSRVQTKQHVKIFPEAREIINKYLDKDNDFVFPLLDNGFDKDTSVKNYKTYQHRMTVLNSNLRRVGAELGVNFNLTTMSARYSFINLAKRNGVPFLYLQELIGHKTNSTTDIYLDVFPQSKIDQYHREVIDLVLNDLEGKMIS